MALRLRDLNKWEQGLPPWEEANPAALLDWIDAREQVWESVAGTPFLPLPARTKPAPRILPAAVKQTSIVLMVIPLLLI